MNKKFVLSIFVGVAGIAVASGLLMPATNEVSQSPALGLTPTVVLPPVIKPALGNTANDSVARVDDTLVKISNTLNVLERRLSALEGASVSAVDEDEAEALTEEIVLSEDEEQMQDHVAQVQKRLDLEARLYEESTDQEWADTMVQSFEADLQNEELSGAAITTASCGESLCKLEIELSEGIDVSEYLQRMSVHRSWEGAAEYSADESGNIQMFIVREGANL